MTIVEQTLLPLLGQSLELAALRQSVHAANIANASVPGYRRLDVSFEQAMQAIDGASASGAGTEPDIDGRAAVVPAAGDGVVRLDQEMALMARDAVQYQAVIGALQREAGLLKLAIWEGKGG